MPRGYGSSRSFSPGANTRERAAQSNRFSGGGYSSTRTRPTPTKSKPKFSFKPPSIRAAESLVQGIKNVVKEIQADKFLGTADYQGSPTGRKSRVKPTLTRGGGGADQDPQYIPPTTIKPILSSPTTAEVSQATTTTAVEPVTTPEEIAETEEARKRRTKRRGRSLTILTGSSGVTGGLTLGIPSLLGR